MTRLPIPLVGLLLLGACVLPPNPSTHPTQYDLSFVVTDSAGVVATARVCVDDQCLPVNAHGYVATVVPPGLHTVRVEAPSYLTADVGTLSVDRHRHQDVRLTRSAMPMMLTIHVFDGDPTHDDKIVGATIDIKNDTGGLEAVTDGAGNAAIAIPWDQFDFEACVEAVGFERTCTDVHLTQARDVNVSLHRSVSAVSRIRIDGRFFVNDAGTFRPVLVGPTSLLRRSAEERAALLDDYARLGFNGIRVFAGALPWAGLAADQARVVLPAVLDELAARGMYAYVSALTESRLYDVQSHLQAITTICAAHPNCFLEIANEPYHPTQADLVHHYDQLADLARRIVPPDLPWALGAPETDELAPDGIWPQPMGPFITIHLDRGRDKWNQIRRLRELAGVSEGTTRPVISGEPMGAAEASIPQRRESDPAFFFAMGAECRGFELGCAFHSDSGLQAEAFGPVTRACAEAFIAGWRSIDSADRLRFENARWQNSPIADARFDQTVVRAFSYLAGGRGWLVLVGLSGDPGVQFKNGWRDGGLVAERPGVQVRALAR